MRCRAESMKAWATWEKGKAPLPKEACPPKGFMCISFVFPGLRFWKYQYYNYYYYYCF